MGSGDTDETLESYGTDLGGRTGTSTSVVEWVLLHGNRMYITLALTVGFFVLLILLDGIGFVSFVNDDSVTRLAGGMIAGTFSLVTLVVSVNQMILSREFRSAGEFRESVEGVMAFRRDVEDAAGIPATPAEPTRQFELLVEDVRYRAEHLADVVDGHGDEEWRETVRRFTNEVQQSSGRVDESLEEAEFGTFAALSTAIGFNDAWHAYAARHLRNAHEAELSEESQQAFDDLLESLRLFNVAREHFKTTYMQRELTRLSQLTILFGVPAVAAAMVLGLVYAGVGGATISLSYIPLVASALMAIVFSPLALLSSYILRTATVARRTASIGPMLPGKDPEEGPFEVVHRRETE